MKQIPFRPIAGAVLLLLLVACATQEARSLAANQTVSATAQPEKQSGKTVFEEKYPAVKLTPDLLYQILSAEIAGQRGRVGYAMRTYLQAAESTRDPRLAERATRIALFAHNMNYATQAAHLWVELDPNSKEAHQVLVSLFLEQHRYGEVKQHLEALASLRSESKERTFLEIAMVLAGSADAETALMLMGNLAPVRKGDPDALYGYAYLAFQLNRLGVALQAVEQVIEQRPGADKPTIMRSQILLQQGKEKAAIASLEKVIDKGQASFSLRLAFGQMLVEAHRLDRAQAVFARLAQEKPNDPDVLIAQGFLALEQQDYEQAENYFRRLLEISERSPHARFYLGRLAELQGHPKKAISWYASITGGGIIIEARIRLAILTAQQGRIAAALQHLELLSRRFPRQAMRFQLAKGKILVDAGRYAEAMELYNKALQDKPDAIGLLYARALVAEKLERFNLLERDLRRILELDPNNAEALNALGYTLADRNVRLKEALSYISRAIELEPNNAFILDSLGWVHYRLGKYEKAEKYLRRALAIREDPQIAAHLGEVLWVQGDKASARSVWQRSLEMNQGNKALLKVMQRFQK